MFVRMNDVCILQLLLLAFHVSTILYSFPRNFSCDTSAKTHPLCRDSLAHIPDEETDSWGCPKASPSGTQLETAGALDPSLELA